MGELHDRAPGLRAIKWHSDWIRRPVAGIALIVIVLAALFNGAIYVAGLMAFMAAAASREWHRMIGQGRYVAEAIVTAVTVVAALGFLLWWPNPRMAWIILLGGMGITLIVSGLRDTNAIWQSAGVLYLGVPSLAIVSLYMFSAQPAWVLIGFLISVWATDTGALVVGKLIGGPKLAPLLSPNKTWAGTLGGIAAAALVQMIFIASLRGGWLPVAALYGALLAVVAIIGDLFESWVKRKFHVKDTGSLIPGHGGILDRVDSTLAAGSVAAVLVLVLEFDPLFGVRV